MSKYEVLSKYWKFGSWNTEDAATSLLWWSNFKYGRTSVENEWSARSCKNVNLQIKTIWWICAKGASMDDQWNWRRYCVVWLNSNNPNFEIKQWELASLCYILLYLSRMNIGLQITNIFLMCNKWLKLFIHDHNCWRIMIIIY